ncbi:glutamate--tRNA ligase family protein [Hymenobacter cellulosilyticus]|uniref:Glutamate--tRNA ligase family protein n=1 Tax=Hymenobacter cellulosilyticus TaxID=2932248 RepID=A0A8T9QD60_9BACT|nr:glutamate--tRNA ligase family protein [Hymenobacter cellulosilyticus]UOQ74058.1 glutamate--tRNA ligase family protein [Hymenobacter cellulosilyticus]
MPYSAPVVSRLAPTPSGYLHLGNAVNFLLTWLIVRRVYGVLHLRIDDLDRARLRPAYLENIFRTIDWLGIDYDHGPSGPEDFERNFSQLHHLAEYEALLQALRQKPGLLYACRCSRTQIQSQANGGIYSGSCQPQNLDFEAPESAWRAHVGASTIVSFTDLWLGPVALELSRELGDFVVRKKDGLPAYQIGSIVDDVRLGVTLIVRGVDLLPSTAAQRWLAGFTPDTSPFLQTRLVHHSLLPGPDGGKLSKSQQQPLDRGIMHESTSPRPVFEAVARLLNLPLEAGRSLAALRAAFENAAIS